MNSNETKGIWRTYSLMKELSSINGPNVSNTLLERVMYNSETLPPLGKEYWWFLFFGHNGEKPIQIMLLIFGKYGKKMLFNGREMVLENLGKNKFQAVIGGWVYDGEKLHDLGDTNAIVEIQNKKIVTEISGHKMMLCGVFPDYELSVGNIIDLNIKKAEYLEEKDARGIFMPPFGVGWVDIFLKADGRVLEKEFEGTAHLQKVIGVTIFGPFHWGRIFFQNDSSVSFFCLKTGKDSKIYLHRTLVFHDREKNEIIRFDNPKLKISRGKDDSSLLIIEGRDNDKDLKIVLETYASKQFSMKGGGSQIYNEYAVIPIEFNLKIKGRVITLEDLGKGVGTFEDAY